MNKELESKINKIIEYIRENYCNSKNIHSCWHDGMRDILEILEIEQENIMDDKDEED